MRNITVNSTGWRYKVGKSYLVAVQPDSRRREIIPLWRVLGYSSADLWQRDVGKQTYYIRVTPLLVADFIKHADWYRSAPTIDIMRQREIAMGAHRPGREATWCESCRDWH